MKKLKIIVSILAMVSMLSCESSGDVWDSGLEVGAVPNIVKDAALEGFINLNEILLGNDIQIGVTLDKAQGEVSSMDLIGFYVTADGDTYGPATLASGVTSFPSSLSIGKGDIVSSFSELSSTNDFQIADKLVVSAKLYLADGREINMLNDDGSRNYGSDIHTAVLYTVQVSYPVSCPSDLAGTYTMVSNGDNTDGWPPAVDFTYTVTLTELGGGSYEISEFSGGVYHFWYSFYGVGPEYTGVLTDVCGSFVGSTFNDPWGQALNLEGGVNADGTLTISWTNPWGDYLVSVLTKQ